MQEIPPIGVCCDTLKMDMNRFIVEVEMKNSLFRTLKAMHLKGVPMSHIYVSHDAITDNVVGMVYTKDKWIVVGEDHTGEAGRLWVRFKGRPRCECGAEKTYGADDEGRHSDWCPVSSYW